MQCKRTRDRNVFILTTDLCGNTSTRLCLGRDGGRGDRQTDRDTQTDRERGGLEKRREGGRDGGLMGGGGGEERE